MQFLLDSKLLTILGIVIGFFLFNNIQDNKSCDIQKEDVIELNNFFKNIGLQGNKNYWCNLRKIKKSYLKVNGNKIPSSLYKLKNLEYLDLSNQGLEGELSNKIVNLENLKVLLLNDNNLTGNIPDKIGFLNNLEVINLGNNKFSGKIPDSVYDLSNLNTLELYNNNLEGKVPDNIKNINIFLVDGNTNLIK